MSKAKVLSEHSCWAILDTFHPSIYGDKTPEVRSDDPRFADASEFFDWCRQHGADRKWYRKGGRHEEEEQD